MSAMSQIGAGVPPVKDLCRAGQICNARGEILAGSGTAASGTDFRERR